MKTTSALALICAALAAGCKSTTPPPMATPVAETKMPAPMAASVPSVRAMVPEPEEVSSNRYVIYAPDGSCKITIDTTKAESMTDWAEHRLAPVMADWYPKISAMIPTAGYTPPTNWTITIAPGNGVAATGGTRVTANYDWFKGQMDKTGPFSGNEIRNVADIANRLRKQSDPISAYLWNGMTKEQQATLKSFQPPATNDAREVILQVFNAINEQPCIYEPARFKGVPLTYETLALLHQSPKNIELSHVNRLLLQDAYAADISRSHKEAVGALLHEEVHVVQQYNGRRGGPPGNFSVTDLTNFPSLVEKIKKQEDPVSAYLFVQMNMEERKALDKYRGPGPTAYVLRTNLLGELNRVIAGPALYNPSANIFRDVTFREATSNLLAEKPEGAELKALNRDLLEDTYTNELAHRAAGGGGRRGGGGGQNTGWLTEGIPDYIRWFIYQPEAHGADFVYFKGKADPKYDAQYRPSAYFLDYVTHKYDPDIVKKVSDAIRSGRYYNDIWSDYTGKSLTELNQEFLDMFHKEKALASASKS